MQKINTKTILFTGGGSAGHVTPNLALIKKFQKQGWNAVYIGSEAGIEKDIISKINIPYYGISSGKLRRQLTWRNLLTPFQVLKGIVEAFLLCRKMKPAVVFSKGGFVAFPVVFAAWANRIPVVAHESDLTPGLANRLSFPFAKIICLTFSESKKYFKSQQKLLVTGTPIREELFKGNAEQGRTFCGFSNAKKILLVFGGGLGAKTINDTVRALLPKLLENYQIVHLCGKGKLDTSLQNLSSYKQLEYVHEELPDIMAATDMVISRAGANSLYELLALRKPHILIPLSKAASRGDQIDNAKYFVDLGLSQVIFEEALTPEELWKRIAWMNEHLADVKQVLQEFKLPNSVEIIVERLLSLARKAC